MTPNTVIVAFVVKLTRSGNFTARQIANATYAEFEFQGVPKDEIAASIKNAAERMRKQHE